MATEVELHEKIVVDGADAAVSKLGGVARAAEKIAQKFESIKEIAGAVGGIAGIFKVVETIREVDHLYQAIGRVKDMTGLAASNAHALFNMFESAGIGAEGAESIIMSLTKSGQRMQQAIAGGSAQGSHMQQIMTRLGISVKDGPEKKIIAMSAAAEKGVLSITDMMMAFNIPRTQAAEMMSMLKRGPAELKKIQADALKSGAIINNQTLENYQQMLQVRRDLGSAWGDLINTFYKNLLPAVTTILKEIKEQFDKIQPVAESIGKFLSAHMHVIVSLAKTYLALMMAAKAVNMFSGEENQKSAFGRLKQVGGFGMRAMAGRAATAGGMDYFAAKGASPGIGMFASAGGPLTKVFGSVAGRLGIIGAIIGVVVVAFEMLKKNVWGLGDALGGSLKTIIGIFKEILGQIVGILGALWEVLKPIVSIVSGALLVGLYLLSGIVIALGKVITAVMFVIVQVINFMIRLLNKLPFINISEIDLDKAKTSADKTETETNGKPENNMDFRGSKFEITNNFPPGIDGGRVAVAFGDDLQKLGDRRLESGLRPVFAYR